MVLVLNCTLFEGEFVSTSRCTVIAERLSARHWIAESGQRWQQVLYVYIYIYIYIYTYMCVCMSVTLLECN